MSSMWSMLVDAPSYSEYSPWFPNPLICLRDMVHSGVTEIYHRAVPWNGVGTWMMETWETVHTTWYWDATSLLVYPLIIALLISALRAVMDRMVFKPITRWFEIPKDFANKFPESGWKCIVYSVTWMWAGCILYFSEENYFFNLKSHWNSWYPGQPVEPGIYWLYMLQLGFYFHSVYATACLETIRKDFTVMMSHHLLSLALLSFSYCVRFHIIGLLVLFFLDIGDIWLELSKILFYLKTRGGRKCWATRLAAGACFGVFAVEFALFRIYWFPTKVIYSAMHISLLNIPGPPHYLLFVPLLWVNFSIQSYWFKFIVQLLWRIMKGEGDKGDTRDYKPESNGHATTPQEMRSNGCSLSNQKTLTDNDDGEMSRKKEE